MLAILNYHNVAEPPERVRLPRLYVSPAQFEQQMAWLRRMGLEGVSLTEGMRRLKAGRAGRCVALTFDDGYEDNLLAAAPVLQAYGFGATCFVVSAHIGGYNVWDSEHLGVRKPLMNGAQIRAWIDAGLEIGSHTVSHPDLTALKEEQVMTELITSRSWLANLTGTPISTFCYPYGRENAQIAGCVSRAGFEFAVTTRRGRAHLDDDELRLPRLSISGQKMLGNFLLKACTPYGGLGTFWRSA